MSTKTQNINIFDQRGCTQLYYVSTNGDLDHVKLFIEKRIYIDATGH